MDADEPQKETPDEQEDDHVDKKESRRHIKWYLDAVEEERRKQKAEAQ